MTDAKILVDHGNRALATWRENNRRVIAWVGPEPLRQARAGIELDAEEERALVAELAQPAARSNT